MERSAIFGQLAMQQFISSKNFVLGPAKRKYNKQHTIKMAKHSLGVIIFVKEELCASAFNT